MRFRTLKAFGAFSVAVLAVCLVVQAAGEDLAAATLDLVTVATAVVAAWTSFRASRTSRRRVRAGWTLVAAGLLAWTAGDAMWAFYQVVLGDELPFPSGADAAYLAGYPLVFAGVLFLAMPSRTVAVVRTAIDASLVVVLAAGPVWHYVLEPAFADNSVPVATRVLGALYPAGDLLILFALAVAALRGWRDTWGVVMGLLGTGLAVMMAADFSFALLATSGDYQSGGLLDLGWVVGYLLVAAAGLTHARPTGVHEEDRARLAPSWRQVLPLAALIPVTIWVAFERTHGPGSVESVLLSVAVTLCVGRAMVAISDVMTLNQELARTQGYLEEANRELTARSKRLHSALADAVETARRDPLTRLLHHAAILEELGARLSQSNDPTAVVMLDIERMKHLNDTLGHMAGDWLLLEVADRLQRVAGPNAGRYGGDEFLVFVEVADGEVATLESELTSALSDVEVIVAGGGVARASVSFGIALSPVDGTTVEGLVNAADQRLYAAKRMRMRRRVTDAA
ncbi:MAG TPA: GGDEF domain-containing protein [Dehalococcoidia bacterium]|nr:GGDEF domain-containing protein [Dehalococcoidia bacterium]